MAEHERFGREPIEVVEIGQDFCSRAYGQAPCEAAIGTTGAQKCFNTRATCQDPANYDRTTLPLKFIDKRSPIPADDYYIPSLTGLSVTPAKLNPGGADRNASALGQRASVTLSFMDHPHNDKLVDPYRLERDYNPNDQGTFWSKWRARNPFYAQRPITLRTGYLKNGEIVDEITRAFVITGFTGPDGSGRVRIKGKDVLTLAEDDKAQAPNISTGKLAADITETATSLTLTPFGVGDIEYPASGYVRINKEVVSFTRSGDTMTISRGQYGTEVGEHDEDDTVQLCLLYNSQEPQNILYDLLTNYANIPPEFLDKTGWDSEASDQLRNLYSTIITEPEGVSKLVSEMCQQMYFTIWFDERTNLVKLRAVRSAQGEQVYQLNDDEHLLRDSISWKDLTDELLTQVWVYYGQNDPTEKLSEGSNYAAVAVSINPGAEGADKHNMRKIKKIFSRWISALGAGAAEELGQRILNRYGNVPRQVTFRVDAKDRYLWLGDYVQVINRLKVDAFGLPRPSNLQIFEAQEAALGSEYQYTAQEFVPALGEDVEDPADITLPITSDHLNVNLREWFESQRGAPVGDETVTFVVRSGVTIGGDAAGGGVNVSVQQGRDDSNDFYAAGNSLLANINVGTVPALFRRLPSFRQINRGSTYPELGYPASWTIREYPVSCAIKTGEWPQGVTLKLIIEPEARVIGQGGAGSVHTVSDNQFIDRSFAARLSVPGSDGGDAIEVAHPVEIENGGSIYSGGGGGATASSDAEDYPDTSTPTRDISLVPGGGGGGSFPGGTSTIVVTVTGNNLYGGWSVANKTEASPGDTGFGGNGGRFDLVRSGGSNSRRAGAGGDAGQQGSGSLFYFGSTPYNVGQGGLPGKAIRSGANLITWLNKGDVRGEEVN